MLPTQHASAAAPAEPEALALTHSKLPVPLPQLRQSLLVSERQTIPYQKLSGAVPWLMIVVISCATTSEMRIGTAKPAYMERMVARTETEMVVASAGKDMVVACGATARLGVAAGQQMLVATAEMEMAVAITETQILVAASEMQVVVVIAALVVSMDCSANAACLL